MMSPPKLLVLLALASLVRCQSCDQDNRKDCGYFGINQEQCLSKGCCWSPVNEDGLTDVPWCFYKSGSPPGPDGGSCRPNDPRSDCGYVGINQTGCEDKGCCWNPKDDDAWCFYKSNPPAAYVVANVEKTTLGAKITLKVNKTSVGLKDLYGDPVSPLVVEISGQTAERLHVKIYDPNSKRWEIPTNISPAPDDPSEAPSSTLYKYKYPDIGDEFSLTVMRASDGDVIFDTSNNELKFFDQYLSISTSLPKDNNIYGLGEHVTPYLKLQPRTYTMWNFDTATPQYLNIYGTHPFYLDLRSSSGNSHGVYLRNSNGMDVILSDNSLTYNVIGGVLDFYFFLGPEAEGVIQQYQEVIGRPHLPPYWALGFHQCRYGYHSVEELEEVVKNYADNKIPLDTMWTDIDYMDQYKDFTLDPDHFSPDKMNSFVNGLHNSGQHYVVIIDPGIKVDDGYSPYTDGVSLGIFINDSNGKIFTGKVWPGITAFPDFFNPKANQYWQDQITKFHQLLPVDGLWIDMNEISNFCNGECGSLSNGVPVPENREKYAQMKESYDKWLKSEPSKPVKKQYVGFDPVSPPYAIDNQGNKVPLETKAVSTDAVHYGGILEYNVHNLFGLTESIATNLALENVRKSRSLVISRSTFPGSGAHTGHWTGDNHADWVDLYQSIPDVLNFQMYGVPLVGADICGFIGNTNEELCGRWMQLGAFYPFSRNHNTAGATPQEPYRWDSVASISRNVLSIRYRLLPYYYTQFYKAHVVPDAKAPPSATVIKPLFFEFPMDKDTYEIDKQFLIGSGILISPVLDAGATTVDAYFPEGVWYDYYTSMIETDKGRLKKTLSAPRDHIPIHIRGGTVIPMQDPGMTTTESRKNPFTLMIALDGNETASGDMFYDDGESLDISNYVFVKYKLQDNELKSDVGGTGMVSNMPKLDKVIVIGVSTKPSQATINGETISGVSYDSDTKTLTLGTIGGDMTKEFTIKWM